jgi:hypothetical protein
LSLAKSETRIRLRQGRCPEQECSGKINFKWKDGILFIKCSEQKGHNRKATGDEWRMFVSCEI